MPKEICAWAADADARSSAERAVVCRSLFIHRRLRPYVTWICPRLHMRVHDMSDRRLTIPLSRVKSVIATGPCGKVPVNLCDVSSGRAGHAICPVACGAELPLQERNAYMARILVVAMSSEDAA